MPIEIWLERHGIYQVETFDTHLEADEFLDAKLEDGWNEIGTPDENILIPPCTAESTVV